jgi:hypothetical protein
LPMTLAIEATGSPPRTGRSSGWRCFRGSATRSSMRRITPSSAGRWIGRNWGDPSPFTPF